MRLIRQFLLFVSAPLIVLVLVGTISARVGDRPDDGLRELKVFHEILYLVSSYYVEDVPSEQLQRGAFQGLAESLDPWSSYYDPVRMEKLQERDESGDVGIVLLKTQQHYARVAAVVAGSPADRAGVEQGQFIETLDGFASRDLTLLEAEHMLRGPVGTEVAVAFVGGGADGRLAEVRLVREDLSALRVMIERLSDEVALLRVTDVRSGVSDLVEAALAELQADGVESLILDLRSNVGGDMAEAGELADLFISGGTLFQRRNREGTSAIEARPERGWSGQLVTLIDSETLGEAELVAAALKSTATGQLVGQSTFGKTSQQDLIRLADGAGLFTTVAHYLRGDGEPFDGGGVQPDEKVARRAGTVASDAEQSDAPSTAESDAGEPVAVEPDAVEPDAVEADAGDPSEEDLQLRRALELVSDAA